MTDSIAVLLLPGRLEGFALEAHARGLLAIPRVIALEASRRRGPRFARDSVSLRQARRLRLPGRLALLILYHPAQYPLARALCAEHKQAELWYVAPERGALTGADAEELHDFDRLARTHALYTIEAVSGAGIDEAPLRGRLRELDVISPRAFVPSARMTGRRGGSPKP
ncbi:MAG: hypothetical protein ACRDMX_03820 [Solirubrobacteraceae bacterium]